VKNRRRRPAAARAEMQFSKQMRDEELPDQKVFGKNANNMFPLKRKLNNEEENANKAKYDQLVSKNLKTEEELKTKNQELDKWKEKYINLEKEKKEADTKWVNKVKEKERENKKWEEKYFKMKQEFDNFKKQTEKKEKEKKKTKKWKKWRRC